MYKQIFDKATDGMLILMNNKFIDCNEAVVKMLGYNNKMQFINTHPSELSPKYQADGRLSSEKADECIQTTIHNGSNTFEWIHLRSNGEPFWVEVVLTDLSYNDEVTILTVWREIGEKKRLEADNAYQKMILDSVISSSVDLIFYKDYTNVDGKYIGCNESFEKFVGKSKENIVGYTDVEIFGDEVGLFFRGKDHDVMQKQGDITNEEWVTYPNGEKILLHTTKSLLRDKDNHIIGILGISRDMTTEYNYKVSLKEYSVRQKALALIDPLTGINNRRSFFDMAEKMLNELGKLKFPITLLMLDIDLFKNVNDTYGHIKGDDILKYVANTIKTRVRKSDICARYGGEEFVVLLINTDLGEGLKLAEEIRTQFSDHAYSDEELTIPITLSIGVCQYSGEALLSELIEKSDKALYSAKKNGRNRIESYK